jgi:hypothetical protein
MTFRQKLVDLFLVGPELISDTHLPVMIATIAACGMAVL